MKQAVLQEQLAESQAMAQALREELRLTQQGIVALTMELEQRVDERTAELSAAHAELKKTNSDLLQLTLELEDRIHERTAELQREITDRKRGEEINQARLHLMEYAAGHSLDELLEETLNETERLTGSVIGFYHFVMEDQKTLTLQNWSTATKATFCKAEGKGMSYDIANAGVWVECISLQQPVIHNDYTSLPNRKGLPPGHADVIRELVVPVIRGDKIMAILGVGNKPNVYTEQDVANVSCLADLAWEIAHRKRVEEEIIKLNAELEQRVIQRTAQLDASNKELEAFAYSVSHDLRAPLRAVDGFSRIIMEEYKGKLDAEGDRLLKVVRNNTQKMDQLITDLLELSRTSRIDIRISPIDMAKLAKLVYGEIAAPEVKGQIKFSVASLPEAMGDFTLIRQVWRNLIANAIKFTGSKEARRIEVGGRTEQGENIYFVKDNGVGFAPEYTHKLFGVFQRLHKASEFEGTGIGLAIVQRIIHRHGGRVWAEGQAGEGATFYFAVPAKEGFRL